MKKVLAFLPSFVVVLGPSFALAGETLGEIGELFEGVSGFVSDILIPLVFALALLMFFYGVFKFLILGGGDEGSRAEGRQLMLWALVAFVVMVSLWGIVNLISGGLGIDDENSVTLPPAPGSAGVAADNAAVPR